MSDLHRWKNWLLGPLVRVGDEIRVYDDVKLALPEGVYLRTREIEKCDKRLTWLAESLDGVVPWPTEPEVNEWHFEPNEAEFVALATPKRIAALAAAAAREQKLREALTDAFAVMDGLRAALAASPASEEQA